MDKIILAFDLSSVCVGVVAAKIEIFSKQPLTVISCPIIPEKFNPEELGFLKYKKKIPLSRGNKEVNAYIKKGETHISKEEKRRRDVIVRNHSNKFALKYIGEQITKIIEATKPDIVLVEKNKIFNGVLTSVLLGKVMGVLVGICASKGIQIEEYEVVVVRSHIDIIKATQDLVAGLSKEEIDNIPDMTKRALRKFMEQKYGQYGLKCATDDESDACVVFDYWFEKILKKG